MATSDDFLSQAETLANLDLKRPKQANLRRAVSSAYYALFHLLTDSAASQIQRGGFGPKSLHPLLRRAFDHSQMKKGANLFRSGHGGLPLHLQAVIPTVSADLVTVASTFVELQQRRHLADYDFSTKFKRFQTLRLIRKAVLAVSAWRRVRNQPEAAVFLLMLLLGDRWNR